jgi:hypothetical protein
MAVVAAAVVAAAVVANGCRYLKTAPSAAVLVVAGNGCHYLRAATVHTSVQLAVLLLGRPDGLCRIGLPYHLPQAANHRQKAV